MPEFLLTSLVLFLVGLVAGTLNVIGGGGSLLSLPVMIFLGLPPTVANGTNRVAILIQNIGAAWSFQRRGLLSREWLLMAVPPALLGALAGTIAAVNIGELAFQRILAVILVAVAAWTLWRPVRLLEEDSAVLPVGVKRLTYIAAFFLIGVYGGFIQAGIGFLILAATSIAGFNLIRGNALKVTLVLTFTPLTLVLFAWNGKVDWAMGIALAAGNFLGGLAGVHLQILKGHAWVRGVVTLTIVVFAIRLLFAS
ncbi:MAG: TSUP family transporter [Xanthomonadales bacterium]|nr:TSUP family transporter [Xanthomonadales bacterium]